MHGGDSPNPPCIVEVGCCGVMSITWPRDCCWCSYWPWHALMDMPDDMGRDGHGGSVRRTRGIRAHAWWGLTKSTMHRGGGLLWCNEHNLASRLLLVLLLALACSHGHAG